MSAIAIDMKRLEDAESSAERIRERVVRAAGAFNAFLCSIAILPLLYYLRRLFGRLDKEISALQIENDEDRERVREGAVRLAELGKEIDAAQGQYAEIIGTMWPWSKFLGSINAGLFEYAARSAEDAAETLALASSREFMDLLERDLSAIDGKA